MAALPRIGSRAFYLRPGVIVSSKQHTSKTPSGLNCSPETLPELVQTCEVKRETGAVYRGGMNRIVSVSYHLSRGLQVFLRPSRS
jgi:hypothetical protein